MIYYYSYLNDYKHCVTLKTSICSKLTNILSLVKGIRILMQNYLLYINNNFQIMLSS